MHEHHLHTTQRIVMIILVALAAFFIVLFIGIQTDVISIGQNTGDASQATTFYVSEQGE